MAKKQILIGLAALMLLSLAAVAYAGPYGNNQNFQQLTPEKQEVARKIVDNFRDEMVPLRDQLWSKQAELDALVQAKLATKKDVKSMISDIGDIRTKITQKRDAFRSELEKETGLAFFGRGNGDCYGNGRGYGGGNGGGRGSGNGNGSGGCSRF